MPVFDIPVLFQVKAYNEKMAAEAVADALAQYELTDLGRNARGSTIESWHMPNHKEADGSDAEVRVEIVAIK